MRLPILAAALLLPGVALANGFQRHETISGHPVPYDFSHRSAYNAATLQEQRRRDCGCGSGSASASRTSAALAPSAPAEVTYSYAIGNWSQVTMSLGSNANGMINNEEHQNNWGNETATLNVDSQNAGGDQTVSNGGEWSGEITDQVIGNDNDNGNGSDKDR